MRQLDRWLAVFGIILSLPGFVLLFFSSEAATAILALSIAAVMIVAAVIVNRLTNQPDYFMNSVEVDLDIKDDVAHIAQLTKSYVVIPNYGQLDRMVHRNIAADGSIQNIKWNDKPVVSTNVREVLGELEVTITFPVPHRKGKEFRGKLSYEVIDSFPSRTEAVHYVVDFPAKVLSIRIHLPPGRVCTSASAVRKSGGAHRLDDPAINNNGRLIEFTVKRPLLGAEYGIYWDW